jgi:hypothetical protein
MDARNLQTTLSNVVQINSHQTLLIKTGANN